VANSQAEADAIASDHTADDIRHGFDRKLNESLATLRDKVQTQIAELKLDEGGKGLIVRSRSTPDYVEVALCRRDDHVVDAPMPSFPLSGNPDIAVRVSRAVLGRIMTSPQLRQQFSPIVNSALVGQPVVTADPINRERSLRFANLSTSGGWLAFELKATSAQDSQPRVALESDTRVPRR
jgi:hypothetical protein